MESQPFKDVPLRTFNPGNETVAIKKGAIAGFLLVPQHLQELYHQSSAEPNKEQQLQLAQLLRSYSSVFSTGPSDLGCTTLVQHDIVTRPGIPVKQPPRQMSSGKQQDADQQIQESLETGLAHHDNSRWASPIVMARKKDGTYPLYIYFHFPASRAPLTPSPLPDGPAYWTWPLDTGRFS